MSLMMIYLKINLLTKSSDFITENGTQDVIIIANLDKAPNNGPVEVKFNISGTAQRDIDYIISNNLVIDQGTSGSFDFRTSRSVKFRHRNY